MLKSHRVEHTLILAIVALLAVGGVGRHVLRHITPQPGWIQPLASPIAAAASESESQRDTPTSLEASESLTNAMAVATGESWPDCAVPTEPGALGGELGPPQPALSDSRPDHRVDLNRASLAELQSLPGIGPALAERIRALREQRGGFAYKEELLDVSGIGPARFEQLVDLVYIGPREP